MRSQVLLGGGWLSGSGCRRYRKKSQAVNPSVRVHLHNIESRASVGWTADIGGACPGIAAIGGLDDIIELLAVGGCSSVSILTSDIDRTIGLLHTSCIDGRRDI